MELKRFFMAHPKAAIAFSGGVDSAYLLYAASGIFNRRERLEFCPKSPFPYRRKPFFVL